MCLVHLGRRVDQGIKTVLARFLPEKFFQTQRLQLVLNHTVNMTLKKNFSFNT